MKITQKRHAFASGHPKELNKEQLAAVEAPHRPLLIVAGAGTGKTRTLTSRLAYIISGGADPRAVYAITFTNKAAKEMAERVSALLGSQRRHPRSFPYVGTFHSLGARILREEARLLGRTASFAIFDDQDSLRLMKMILKSRQKRDIDGPSFFLKKISQFKNGVATPEEAGHSPQERDRRAALIYELYEQKLKENNAFDFDDLILKTLFVLEAHPNARARHAGRIEHLLVDEYQDLNKTQYELVRLLAGEHGRLSVVGDDQQMIYGWRYADLDIFLNFEREWPGAQVLLLEENYRSTSTIINAASAVIANNERQKPKTLWTKNTAGEPITVFEAADEREEATWVAERVSGVRCQVSVNGNQPSVAILYRTNAQSRAIEQALIERRIPYRVYGGLKFYDRREVKDIVAALRFASNPRDTVSRDRLFGIFGKRGFAEIEQGLLALGSAAPVAVIGFFLKKADYFEYLDRYFQNAAERKENVAELTHFASQFASLRDFLEHASLVEATDDLVTDTQQLITKNQLSVMGNASFVNLMTIHLAKGLEFGSVFVVGCAEGLLPHARSLENNDQLEEERRLMYVAMTRARFELSLSFYGIPSRFLFEMPQELTSFQSSLSGDSLLVDDEERYITID